MISPQAQALSVAKMFGMKDLRIQCRARGISPAGSKETLVERLVEDMVATRDFEVKPEPEAAAASAQLASQAACKPRQANNYNRPDGQNVGNFITDRPTSRVLAPPGGSVHSIFGGEPELPKPRVRQVSRVVAPWATEPESETNTPTSRGGVRAPTAAAPAPAVEAPAPVLDQTFAAVPEPEVYALADAAADEVSALALQGEEEVEQAGEVDPAAVADAQVTLTVGGIDNKYGNNYARPGGQNVGNFITDKPSSRVLAPPGGGSKISFG